MPDIAPPPAPPSTQPNPSGPNMTEAFAGFDALVAEPAVETPGETKPNAGTKPDAAPASPSPGGEGRGEGGRDNPPSPGGEGRDEGGQSKPPLNPQPSTKVKAATLRDELDRTRTEAADWRGKFEKLQAEISKPKPDPEKEQLLKDRETWNKSRADLENEIKFARYERSQEYKDKYEQPFLSAYEQGQKLVAGLSVKEPDQLDQFGEVTEPGKARKATGADWDALMAITDEDAANKFIADHFGHNAARVTIQRVR